jgi:hypothetical protein
MTLLTTSSLSEKEIAKAPKSGVPVVFLGGSCKENNWRKKIEREFGEDFYLLDPFDKDYDPKKDTYKELAGMVNSDYVIFYKGGKQSLIEKKFLDLIDMQGNKIKDFDSIDNLKKFLSNLKGEKLKSISSKIRKCAEALSKISMPFVSPDKGISKAIDFKFERLDTDSIPKVVNDIFSGKTIRIPKYDEATTGFNTFNIKSLSDPDNSLAFLKNYRDVEHVRKTFSKRNPESILFTYDAPSSTYVDVRTKVAKTGVSYDYSCTKINLPDTLSEAIMKWGKENVPDNKLYIEGDNSKGREDDIHVTVLYGIVDSSPVKTAEVIGKTKPFEVRLGLINAFKDKKEYDVLKIEIEAGSLEKLHYDLVKNIKNENSFPTYTPHVTIAYVKKNSMDEFIGDETFKGKTFKADHIVFSNGKNKDKEKKLPLDI